MAIQRRLEEAGFPTKREDNVECCYALQTKFWVSDPDRALWEIYVFHEDVDRHGDGSVPDFEGQTILAEDATRARVVWEHQIPDALPSAIPHADNSLDEISLAGTINMNLEPTELARILRDAFRCLRPGGALRIHGLAGDRPLTVPLPALPGPAAIVQRVPVAVEPMQAMVDAGLIEIRFEKLSTTVQFTVDDVKMREVVLIGCKPGYRPRKLTHEAIYLGPLAQVTDDFGNVFRRGEWVALNIHDWQVLSRCSAGVAFQFLSG